MKNLTYTLIIFLMAVTSCNEEEWLKEDVYDFNAADDSYLNEEQFNAAVATLYGRIEPFNMMIQSFPTGAAFFYMSDIGYEAFGVGDEYNSYVDKLVPECDLVSSVWTTLYRTISYSNTIISRIDNENVQFSSEASRSMLKAEARFFRAYSYRWLGILYGGVPLVLEELREPKRDFVRASEDEIWAQCISDLEYAVENLPETTMQDGRLTKAAANHLLTEIYIIKKDYDKAIASASAVINNPNYALMINRFGKFKDREGDVYGDLFRRGSQNRHGSGGGNTEEIWVKQYEDMVAGGGGGYRIQIFNPIYRNLKGDADGQALFIGPTAKYGGVTPGWAIASDYLLNEIWNDPADIRNSEYNVMRDIVSDNPASVYYGKKIIESGAINNFPNVRNRWWTAIWAKISQIDDFPEWTITDPATGVVWGDLESSYRDHYVFRLAETYLLRAEAYLGKGDKANAANDINVVRARANASPVASGDIDIDFILDERARELHFEEPRVLTLMRTGKLVERVRIHNPYYNGKYANTQILDHHAKWPIPSSEIERNTKAVLEQNPGY